MLSGNCLCLSQRDTAPRLLIKPAACVIARSPGQLTGCRFYDTYRLHSCSHAIREEILCDHRKQTLCSSSASPSFYEEFDDAARARWCVLSHFSCGSSEVFNLRALRKFIASLSGSTGTFRATFPIDVQRVTFVFNRITPVIFCGTIILTNDYDDDNYGNYFNL